MKAKEIGTAKTLLTVLCAIFILVLAQEVSRLAFLIPLPTGIASIIFGFAYVTFSYLLILICCRKMLNTETKNCYIGKPRIPFPWFIWAFLLPLSVSALLLCCPGELSKNNLGTVEAINTILNRFFVVGVGAGIVEEMVFRGLIMKTLEKRWGRPTAVIFPSLLFGLLHIIGNKMDVVDLIQLMIAGTSVGIMFSLIVYESGSIWPSALVHGIWNLIMIGPILQIGTEHTQKAIFSYKLASKSTLITGGVFGVEASIFAIIGYLVVILWTLYSIKKKKKGHSPLPSEKKSLALQKQDSL